jgi:Cu-processing system permease protein
VTQLARIWAIAMNTIREAVRNKILYVLLVFALVLNAMGLLASMLSYVERDRILQDVGFAAIRLFGVAIAISMGVGLIHKEVDRRTVFTILSKPLSRAEFLVGKYAGLTLTLWMQLVFMVGVFCFVSFAGEASVDGGHMAAFLLTGVELALVIAVATFFSAFTTPMLSALFTSGLWVVGHLTRSLRDVGAASEIEVIATTTALLHRVLPDLESFNLSMEAVHGLPVPTSEVWLAALYGAGYIAILLVAAVWVFERRDFR